MEQIAEEELDACLGYQLTRARAHGRVKASCHRDISRISTRTTIAHIEEYRVTSVCVSRGWRVLRPGNQDTFEVSMRLFFKYLARSS